MEASSPKNEAEEPIDEQIAKNREDFMRRWFAIAISVGFATTVVQMPWVTNGRLPEQVEFEQLCRLGAALIATVLSWEGYLLSIKKKKLYEFSRYFIDIILVFIYLFLLLTSKYEKFWLFLHALTFCIYVLWDFLTVTWHKDWYGADGMSVRQAYLASFVGREGVDRGLAISITWAIYFTWLWMVSLADFANETFIMAAFVVAGLAGYRRNKSIYRTSGRVLYFAPLILSLIISSLVMLIQ